jgi:hypothetical protein
VLIARRMQAASKELNRAVSVLGNNVDPSLIINRIRAKYFGELDGVGLAAKLMITRDPNDAIALVRMLNGIVVLGKERGLIGGKNDIHIRCNGKVRTFSKQSDMVDWVIHAFASELPTHARQ